MRKERLVEFGGRITEKLGKRSFQDMAKGIDMSYEMTRRYAKGWAMPDDPKVLERIAAYLGTSVGWLLAEEQDAKRLPPLHAASAVLAPITAPIRLAIEDEAMTLTVDNVRLFGIGDHVTLYPRKALPGDVVAIRANGTTTLRRLTESGCAPAYVPRKDGYATYTDAAQIGVVAGVYGVVERFK